MSTTAPDVVSASGSPISPTHLVAYPGTSPSATVPVVAGAIPEVDDLWSHLAEPAEFFGVAIPSAAVLGDALREFVDTFAPVPALLAVTVTLVAGESRFVVSGSAVQPVRSDAVRIDRCDVDVPLTVPEDPHWRRMAARTTSRADRDQLRRWLADRGCADAVGALFVPFLGALLWECAGDVVGVDNPEPTSVLAQLQPLIGEVRRVHDGPAATDAVWWLSPDYELHPVRAIGDTAHPVTGDTPTFTRQS